MTSLDLRRTFPLPLLLVLAFLLGGIAPAVLAAPKAPPEDPALADGIQLIRDQKWKDAEKWFWKFLKEHPDHAEAMRKYGFVELRRPGGDAVRAREFLEKADRREPGNPVGMFLLAKAYEATGEWKLARETYDRLIELGPGKDDPVRAGAVHLARFNRALIAIRDQDWETAEKLLDVVLRRDPRHAYAWYEKAGIAAARGDTEKALELYRKTREMLNRWAPSEAWTYPQSRYSYIRENTALELAKLYLAKGDAAKAEEVLRPVVDLVRLRAKAGRQQTDTSPKTPLQGEADRRFENAPYWYAKALIALGKKKEAKKLLKEFSRMKLGDPELRDEARQLYRKVR